jgi:glycosyltransferase involved in cell wall biosynthesis
VWLETGPLVVLEAFAAGIPVLGSNLGGISELLMDAADTNAGLLVEPGNASAWADAIGRLASNRAPRSSSRPTPRRASDIAGDMRHIYDEILAS